MVRHNYSVDIFGVESRKWIKIEVGIGERRMPAAVKEELMSFTFLVK